MDFEPSRGAVHRVGDTWVSLDASFKPYQYTPGLDLVHNVPLDEAGAMDEALSSAEVDDAAGWIRGIDSDLLQEHLSAYQDRVRDYILAHEDATTVGDIFGAKSIVATNHEVLATSLPYRVMARGGTMAQVPDQLRHQFGFALYASALDRHFDTPVLRYVGSLSALSHRKLSLSFQPASPSDAALLASFAENVPEDPADFDLSTVNASLPGYLIELTAELRVDGEVVASGGVFRMGEELVSTLGLYDPVQGWDDEDNRVIAGEFQVVMVDGAGVARSHLESQAAKAQALKAQAEAGELSGVSAEVVLGEWYYTALLTYFWTEGVRERGSAGPLGMVSYRRPSFGRVTSVLQPQYVFGVARRVMVGSVEIDIDRVGYVTADQAHDRDRQITYVIRRGFRLSGLEHVVLERVLSLEGAPVEAVSTVKALGQAHAEGQRLYLVSPDNGEHSVILTP
ncbi:MAG: hypothetical protein ETSY2_15790, partial [Candidatus Entotheonella gemina]